MLILFQGLNIGEQEKITSVFNNNSYFAHPENILLTAIANESIKV